VQDTFKANLAAIQTVLNDASFTWVSGPTYFTDLSSKDKRRFLGGRSRGGGDSGRRRLLTAEDRPDGGAAGFAMRRRLLADASPGLKVDWSMTGSYAKMQGACGSCW
jgi:hypothetical protein